MAEARTLIWGTLVAVALMTGVVTGQVVKLEDGTTVELNSDGTYKILSTEQTASVQNPDETSSSLSELIDLADNAELESIIDEHLPKILAASENDRKLLEDRIYQRVAIIPASEKRENASGYHLLSKIDPKNPRYNEKYRLYTAIPTIDIGEIAQNLSDKKTRVQRDTFWEKIDGSRVAIAGKITDVRPAGFLSYGKVEIDAGYGVGVSCELTEEAAVKLDQISKGDKVRCEGTAYNYVLLLGALSFAVKDGLILER